MEKLKVVHVLYSGLGGHGSVVFPLLESSFGEEFENILVFFGVEEMIPAYKNKCNSLNLPYYSIQKKPKRYIKSFKRFRKLLKTIAPNRIIIHNSELIIPGLAYRKKHQNCRIFYVEHQDSATKSTLQHFLTTLALKTADGLICLTEKDKKQLKKRHSAKSPVIVIPNGVMIGAQNTTASKGSPIIGMASRMTKTKDHTTLILAFKEVLQKHPSAQLQIAGDGETFSNVEALVKYFDLTENIKFLGMLDEEEMRFFYSQLSINVLATTSETLSTALLQAMACGLPVITSDIENNALLITNDVNGWLYKDQNVVDLTAKINYVIEHPAKALEIGIAARSHIIAHYSIEKTAKLYTALIREH